MFQFINEARKCAHNNENIFSCSKTTFNNYIKNIRTILSIIFNFYFLINKCFKKINVANKKIC